MGGRVRGVGLVLGIMLCLGAFTGCGTAASPSPPTGVDGLVIPTPTPDPRDFVATVDNPWFPLPPGARWTYDVSGLRHLARLQVTASAGPDVAGVPTTEVISVLHAGGRALRRSTDLYAQDRAGNVWWFGHHSGGDHGTADWRAGLNGAEAGLEVPAAPRLGDGFRSVLAPAVADVRAQVSGVAAKADVLAGHYYGVLVMDADDAVSGEGLRRFYARGVGVVETQTLSGLPNSSAGLTSTELP